VTGTAETGRAQAPASRPEEEQSFPGFVDKRLFGTDRLSGQRDALAPGALGDPSTQPQGDENRDPPQGAPTKPP
jgi:hypothetical protein